MDPQPQRYHLQARASELDPRVKAHPEIDFVLEKDGKPADVEHASVDTRVKPRGRLVVWLMDYNDTLLKRLNDYGLAQRHPQGDWKQFLSSDGSEVRWNKVIVAGASHGATTAARFAKEVKVDRVVMLCGPVWRYLFTHGVDTVGTPSPKDPGCQQDHPLGR